MIMKKIRKSVFETNSSSSHSFSFSYASEVNTLNMDKKARHTYKFPLTPAGYYILSFGMNYGFNEGFDKSYNTLEPKLNFLASLAVECYNDCLNHNTPINNITDILKIKDIERLVEVIKKHNKSFKGFKVFPGSMIHCRDFDGIEKCIPESGVGNIDREQFSNLYDWEQYNKISIEEFLFNPTVVLNVCGYPD